MIPMYTIGAEIRFAVRVVLEEKENRLLSSPRARARGGLSNRETSEIAVLFIEV